MSGFAYMNGVAVDADGRPDPQQQLFRSTAVGVETGPMISQVCSFFVWAGLKRVTATV